MTTVPWDRTQHYAMTDWLLTVASRLFPDRAIREIRAGNPMSAVPRGDEPSPLSTQPAPAAALAKGDAPNRSTFAEGFAAPAAHGHPTEPDAFGTIKPGDGSPPDGTESFVPPFRLCRHGVQTSPGARPPTPCRASETGPARPAPQA